DIVLIDLSNAGEALQGEPERISKNIVDLLPIHDQAKYNALERSKYHKQQQELFNIPSKDNYTYLLTQRPPSIGTHPDGQIGDAEPLNINGRQVYKIKYAEQLSKEEI